MPVATRQKVKVFGPQLTHPRGSQASLEHRLSEMFSLYGLYEVGSLCLLAALVRGLLMAVLVDSSVVLGILATP